ncbi:unnamed protein product [Durusdinium trenchii]|uniref:Uncharacterized protein n=2 Tax=Durusdinium trenchii TaxID=1381693 RepID=A0ABP0Q033_9DINO
MQMLLKALRLLPHSLLWAGPPCSMFIFLGSSQHLRHLFGPEGAPWDRATRLANIIACNMVTLLFIIKEVRNPWVVIEQPKGSWMLKLPPVVQLKNALGMMRVLTYQCFWGHQLEKATWLLGDLPTLNSLQRTLTMEKRHKYSEKRNNKKYEPMYVKGEDGTVHGLPALAKSAVYPKRFCNAIAKAWEKARSAAYVPTMAERCAHKRKADDQDN